MNIVKKTVHPMLSESAQLHPSIPRLAERVRDFKMDRREFISTATALGATTAAAYAMIGLKWAPPVLAQTPKEGGTVRMSMSVRALFDPALAEWSEHGVAVRQVNEYLIDWRPNGALEPWLAESWEANEDATIWTFRLRRNIAWHNGDAFEADDVIFNFKRWLRADLGSSNQSRLLGLAHEVDRITDDNGNEQIVYGERPGAIEKVDSHTIRLTLASGDIALVPSLGDYPTSIQHRDFEAKGSNWVENPVGTGPFELLSYEVGQGASYKRNENYWGQRPYIEGIEIQDLGADKNAEVNAFVSDQIDINYETNADQVEVYERLGDVDLVTAVTNRTGVARFNVNEALFSNKKFRQAILSAVDQQEIIDKSQRGFGLVAENHHVSPSHPEYAELPPFRQDVAKAKRLLEESGVPEAEREVTLICVNDPIWESDACQALADMLGRIGVRVKLQVMPGATYWTRWNDWPFSFTSWNPRPLGTQVYVLAYRSGAVWNETKYNNPEFDALIDQATSLADPDQRRPLMAQMEAMLQDDGIIIQSVWRSIFATKNKRIQGFELHPSSFHDFRTVWMA